MSVPAYDHIVVAVMENHDYNEIIGDTQDAPYINNLAANGALLTNYTAITHPSEPNYFAFMLAVRLASPMMVRTANRTRLSLRFYKTPGTASWATSKQRVRPSTIRGNRSQKAFLSSRTSAPSRTILPPSQTYRSQ